MTAAYAALHRCQIVARAREHPAQRYAMSLFETHRRAAVGSGAGPPAPD